MKRGNQARGPAAAEAPAAAATESDEARGLLYELIVQLPSRNRLLADLSATLSGLNLDVLDGEIVTDENGRARDRLRVRARPLVFLHFSHGGGTGLCELAQRNCERFPTARPGVPTCHLVGDVSAAPVPRTG